MLRGLSWVAALVAGVAFAYVPASRAADSFTSFSVGNTAPSTTDDVRIEAVVVGVGAAPTGTVTFKTGSTTFGAVETLSPFVPNLGKISASGAHACALISGGTVDCWGDNASGQTRPGSSATFISVPVPVPGITGATVVQTGSDHSCAIIAGGEVMCWGDNAEGQLGNGTAGAAPSAPVKVTGVTNATALALGQYHSCALIGGSSASVKCWGAGSLDDGRLGDNQRGGFGNLTAVTVTGFGSALPLAIRAGSSHTCALLDNDAVACWGNNDEGQLGDGTMTSSAFAKEIAGSSATAIAAATDFTCFLTPAGEVRCQGINGRKQLGNTSAGANALSPVTVQNLPTTAMPVDVAAGGASACVLYDDGSVYCWGENGSGQLGRGTTTPSSDATPAAVSGLQVGSFGGITVGGAFACAYDGAIPNGDGTAKCWGRNVEGQLGTGTTTNASSPTSMSLDTRSKVSRQQRFGAGTDSFTAHYSGDTTFSSSVSNAISVTATAAAKIDQTITFAAPADRSATAANFDPGATASSSLTVEYTSADTAVCQVVSGLVDVLTEGICQITAGQPGNDTYNPAPEETVTFNVTLASQTVTLTNPGTRKVYDDPFTLSASTTGVGTTISFSSLTPSICKIQGGNKLAPLDAGTCTVKATASETTVYETASATVSFAISDTKKSQTISFYIGVKFYVNFSLNIDTELRATSSSGLKITFESNTPQICRVENNNIKPLTLGTCEIRAIQAGNEEYRAASITRTTLVALFDWDCCETTGLGTLAKSPVEVGKSIPFTLTAISNDANSPDGDPYAYSGEYTLFLSRMSGDSTQSQHVATQRGLIRDGKINDKIQTEDLEPGIYGIRYFLYGDPLVELAGEVGLITGDFSDRFEVIPKASTPQPAVKAPATSTASITIPSQLAGSIVQTGFSPQTSVIVSGNVTGATSDDIGANTVLAASSDTNILERSFNMRTGRFDGGLAQLNEAEGFDAIDPDAVMLADGSMVTAWTVAAGSKRSIAARIVSKAGDPAGDAFDLTEAAAPGVGRVTLAATTSGFLAVWESAGGLVARTFDKAGKPTGIGQSQLLGIRGGMPELVSLPAGSGGSALLIYRDDKTGRPFGAVIDAAGKAGKATRLSKRPIVDGGQISAALLFERKAGKPEATNTVVTGWTEVVAGKGQDIRLALVTVKGGKLKLGKTAIANTGRSGNQSDPSVASFTSGGFAVTWTAAVSKTDSEILAALFTNKLKPYGSEFSVATSEKGLQSKSVVITTDRTNFLVGWVSILAGKASFEVRPFDLGAILPK